MFAGVKTDNTVERYARQSSRKNEDPPPLRVIKQGTGGDYEERDKDIREFV